MEDDDEPASTEALENRPSTRKSRGKATRRSARRRCRRGGQLVHHATEPFGRLLRLSSHGKHNRPNGRIVVPSSVRYRRLLGASPSTANILDLERLEHRRRCPFSDSG